MLMEKRMYIALIFVAAFLCSYAQQSDLWLWVEFVPFGLGSFVR